MGFIRVASGGARRHLLPAWGVRSRGHEHVGAGGRAPADGPGGARTPPQKAKGSVRRGCPAGFQERRPCPLGSGTWGTPPPGEVGGPGSSLASGLETAGRNLAPPPPTPAGDLGLPQDTAHLSVLVCETAVGWPTGVAVGVATGPSPASSTPQPGSWLGARLSETGRLTHGAPRGVGAWKTLEMWQFLLLTFLFKNMLHFSKRVFHQKCDFLGFAPTAWGGRCSVFCCFHTRSTRVPVK